MGVPPTPAFGNIRGPIVDEKGNTKPPFTRLLTQWQVQLSAGLSQIGDIIGQISAAAKIQGRTEGIGTTVTHLTATGALASTDNIAADGTGSPLTGGKRGFVALSSANRLANSFRGTGVNVSSTPTSATVLSNTGAATAIIIAASSNQFAPGAVSYNSGSVDPGAYGTYYVYADDPTFSGGVVTYQFSANAPDQTAAEGRVLFGKILTVGGSAKTGGGSTGGTTPGGGGGRGYVQ